KFFYYISKAEKINTDPKYAYLINTKLADFYYNEQKYKEAIQYYKKLLKNKKNGWITKHYYNLAWSLLKVDKYDEAVKNLKRAYIYELKPGYFKIGDQIIDSLLLFFAYSDRTQEGIKYFDKVKISSFKNLIKYLHYVFEHGKKKNIKFVLKRIEKINLTPSQSFVLLSKRVVAYRALKMFKSLQVKFDLFRRKYLKFNMSKVKLDTRRELVKAIKGYTGYLQELIKSKRLIKESRKKTYIKYIANNFNVLKLIDPKNTVEYTYYEGETYFSVQKFKTSASVYSSGIRHLQLSKKKRHKFLDKTFESLFKSIENQKKPSSKSLLFAYTAYLGFYPKGKKARTIYQRLINLYRVTGKENKMFKVLRAYNKYYPKDVKLQKNMYKHVLNKYISMKNLRALDELKSLIDKGFLGFTLKESLKLSKIITQIHFSSFEDLAKRGKFKEAIAGFYQLYLNKKNMYSLRVDALRKKMFYENKQYHYEDLAKTLHVALKFYKLKKKEEFGEEFLYYAQNICVGDLHKECTSLLRAYKKDKTIKLTRGLQSLYFKLASATTLSNENVYRLASNDAERNYGFKLLMIRDGAYTSKVYNQYYKNPKMKGVIDETINKKVLHIFYRSLSFDRVKHFVNKLSIKSIKNKHLKVINTMNKLRREVRFSLPDTPEGDEMTEKIFMSFGQQVETGAQALFTKLNGILNRADPNYLPFISSLVVNRFEEELVKFKKFIPVSKNADLEAAMSDAVTSFHKSFDQKLIEYRSLYFKSLKKTEHGSGVKVYASETIKAPLGDVVGGLILWQE
ncbi:MAG: hypothetical protein HON90_15110, partial [Halobacteriovoraceae bacterium]|nr:hypothetical protein [Halobacteriovoraceae bacterium]